MLPQDDPLNIWNELAQADKRNIKFYAELTDEQKKKIGLFPIMRWMSSVNASSVVQGYYIEACNDINKNWFELGNHPELQWMLLATVGTGTSFRHNWIPNVKRNNSNKLDKLLYEYMPYLNKQELEIVKSRLTADSLKDICKKYGMEDKEIKGYLDEFKKIKKEG